MKDRIGSDTHDELAPYLSSLCIDLELLNRESDALTPEASKTILNMRHKIRHTIVALRRIISGMLPLVLENETLDNALKELCAKNDGHKGTNILFRTTGVPIHLNEQQKLYLYTNREPSFKVMDVL